jgi:hypothetical protein
MLSRSIFGGALAAIAGAVMLAATVVPSDAFTLSSPSLEQPVLSADIQDAYWCRWGRCGGWHRWGGGWGWHRPWGWHRWGWRRPWGWHRTW